MKKDYLNYARYANFAMSFGITSVAAMLLGFLGGQWLDQKLGTSPLFLLAGIFLGVGLSFKHLMTELKILHRAEELARESERNGGKGEE